MTSFAAQVDKWTRRTSTRMELVFRESAQRTFELAQVPTGKGGRMRVDTGFLRASGQASLTGLPSGETVGDKRPSGDDSKKPLPKYDDIPFDETVLVISGAKIGDTITYGWTANYAEFRNFEDGFMTFAILAWQQTVDKVVRDAKARVR